jgi:hypothetical protein
MPSSESVRRRIVVAKGLVLGVIGLLAACSAAPVGGRGAQSTAAGCATDAGLSPQDAEAGASLQRTVEAGPLYEAIAGKAALASCRIGNDSGAATLEYKFSDSGWMRVTRDARIEYTSHEVRFGSAYADSPLDVLRRAEQAAFGTDGCAIDWRRPERSPAADDATATETIYRGSVCNCQARVRGDSAGRTVGLVFRSAC